MTAHAEQHLFIQATSDLACFHGSLLVATTVRSFLQRTPLLLESFYHRGEAIRLANERLANFGSQTTDGTIAAIVCLATFDVYRTPALKIVLD